MDKVLLGVILFPLTLAIALLTALPFMWIWNYAIVAAVEPANHIGYWHSYWLSWLLMILSTNTSCSGK